MEESMTDAMTSHIPAGGPVEAYRVAGTDVDPGPRAEAVHEGILDGPGAERATERVDRAFG
jgi:hypothetical protein